MAPTYLDGILQHHRARAGADTREWRQRVESISYTGPSMLAAMTEAGNPNVRVIAEVKRRSPSRGWLNEHLDPVSLARTYLDGGATATSVLTDEHFFAGSRDDLERVARTVDAPILRKDFTVSANDVLDTADMGASTVLLIAAALDDEELSTFVTIADRCNIDALVEVHNRDEVRRALAAGARMIGVNQRNLRTFHVDPDLAEEVITVIPRDVITVCESGLRSTADVERAARAGFDAVLVGEAFVTSNDANSDLRAFCTIPKVSRD